MATNLDLAKRLAEFADALAQYNHLPTLSFAVVGHDGLVRTQPEMTAVSTMEMRVATVGGWADTFHTPVLLDLSDMDSGVVRLTTIVEIAGRDTSIAVALLPSQYREFEARLAIGEVQSGEQVQVTGQQLLTAVSS